ncbi:hypothetical protein VXO74_15210 [Acinetobacter junii]|uniref:hypothetical protein n=1 Tax=Acinetobacter junii TaxID=40215 RepID=UPI003A8C7C18
MYSVYKIYQADKLVLVIYSDLIPEFTDTTKLKLILNGPTIPISLFESYFKTPELFSITTHSTGISNALDASQIVIEQSKLIGTPKPTNRKTANRANKETKTIKKQRTKKAQQSITEG